MIIRYRYLNTEIKNNIKNRSYAPEDIAAIHQSLKADYLKRVKQFIISGSIIAIALAAFAVWMWGSIGTKASLAAFVIAAAIAYLYYWIFNIKLIVWQFTGTLKKAYPELLEDFGKESFRK